MLENQPTKGSSMDCSIALVKFSEKTEFQDSIKDLVSQYSVSSPIAPFILGKSLVI